jgi:signal transduction histidine kinase
MNGDATRILLVEDNAGDARLLREALADVPATFELRHVQQLRDGVDALCAGGVDVVLLDLSLPDATGLEGLRRLHGSSPGVPIVVLTGLDDDELALRAMQEGAQDYLVKGRVEGALLARAIRYAVERKRAEEAGRKLHLERAARIEAEALAQEREDMVAIVAHDLRNPLAVVAYASAALRRAGLHAGQEKQVDKIDRAVARMNRLMSDLLDIARIEAGRFAVQPARVPVGLLLADAVESVRGQADDKSISLTCSPAESLPPVWADRERLLQALGNLLANAIKFTAEGGAVALCAEEASDQVHFAVSDTGPGIPEGDQPHVFERYWQGTRKHRQGMGLGLAIAQGIVQAHGGRIWVESSLGSGSTFRLTLPSATAHLVPLPVEPPPPKAA